VLEGVDLDGVKIAGRPRAAGVDWTTPDDVDAERPGSSWMGSGEGPAVAGPRLAMGGQQHDGPTLGTIPSIPSSRSGRQWRDYLKTLFDRGQGNLGGRN